MSDDECPFEICFGNCIEGLSSYFPLNNVLWRGQDYHKHGRCLLNTIQDFFVLSDLRLRDEMLIMKFFVNLDFFLTLYFLKMCPIFVNSMHNFDMSVDVNLHPLF